MTVRTPRQTMNPNDLTPDQLRALADAIESRDRQECTGWGASWCPIHGDCTCAPDSYSEYEAGDDHFCPLHGDRSAHVTDP